MNADSTTDHQTHRPGFRRPGAVRFAHTSNNYTDTISFYRDLVGLPVIGEFVDSFDSDGTIFGLPDASVHLEIVRARHDDDAHNGDGTDQLVIYLDNAIELSAATSRLREAGLLPDPAPHAYWAANGAVTYRDPDGRAVVFAPWVFGRDLDPVDREAGPTASDEVRIQWYDGDRDAIRFLFAEAEDSPVQLTGYIDSGRVLVAWQGSDPVGHLQLVPTGGEGEVELKNMAVVAARRGTGIGRRLVDSAVRISAADGNSRLVVATAAADIGNLRFYQRCGFRFTKVERDAFSPTTGYPDPVMIGGIPLRDRVWLAQDLTDSGSPKSVGDHRTRTPPHELRVVITVVNHDIAVGFYRDVLGLRELAAFTDDNAGRATLLDAGRATVEIGDQLHADAIDSLEVGHRIAGQFRLAFAVDDAGAATERLVIGGATVIAAAAATPWGSLNSRVESPDGHQITLFSDETT